MAVKRSGEGPETGPEEAAPHYHGHRERLRARFREAGSDAVTDYELLELVLFRALPRRDVKPLAKSLISKFGSFAETIAASPQRLAEVAGLGDAAITELKVVEAAAHRLARGEVKRRPVLASWSAVLDYCRAAMAFADKEAVPHPVPRQTQPAHRRRGPAGRHRRPHPRLPPRGRQARTRTLGHRGDPGAQPSDWPVLAHARSRLITYNHCVFLDCYDFAEVHSVKGAGT
jgi:hypothetical protein